MQLGMALTMLQLLTGPENILEWVQGQLHQLRELLLSRVVPILEHVVDLIVD